jgi:tRNA(adenine34) deaminase
MIFKFGNKKVSDILTDESYMRYAIRLAQRAEDLGEVPVGALLVKNGKVIAEGWNQMIALHDSTAHAEMMAIRGAGKVLENYRLIETTLYVTLEPCVMCMGAIAHARIQRLVFGAFDEKRGCVCNALNLSDATFLNHHVAWQGGVLKETCSQLLKDFFAMRRKKSQKN